MPLSQEDRDLLTLHLVPGIGPRLIAALLERFGSADAALRASPRELMEVPHLGPKVAEMLKQTLASREVDEECEMLERLRIQLLRLGTAEYPVQLAQIPVPPRFLYVRGALLPADKKAVAIVGSRSCTSYGRRIAERLAYDLAQAGWTIVSGLARGIDSCAHQGALKAKGRTIAVLAGGLSKIYPPEHAELSLQVADNGACVSEAALRMEPMAGMFPARNRVISGLSRAIILVEAAEKSGALITATHAAEQGRDVYAVPGPVDSVASGGTLKLLRNGARLVRHAQDVLEELEGLPPLFADADNGEPETLGAVAPPNLTDTQRQLWDYLDEQRTIDELTRHLELPSGEVSRHLMVLEMKKIVRRLPGNWYERF